MSSYLAKRLAILAGTLAAASIVVFVVLEVLPGNAAQVMLGADASQEAVATLTRQLGLDQPALVRYVGWLREMVGGDLGMSFAYGSSVTALIAERVSVTLPLAILAMVLTTVMALSLAIYAAARANTLADFGTMAVSQIGVAIPSFWLAILLILFFSVRLHWFAAGGFPGWSAGLWPAVQALILPSLALSVVQAAILARVTRSALLDVMREDFVRTARAKGLSREAALWRHALPNALIPIVTIMGLQFANLLAGTVVIENVFYLPGLGRLIFQSIANRDIIVVRSTVMLLVAMVVVVNFLVDILAAFIDPRLRASSL
jgi:peptide/nickel transport system permease protein